MNCLGMQVACADKVGSASRGMGEAQEAEEGLLECTRASPIVWHATCVKTRPRLLVMWLQEHDTID